MKVWSSTARCIRSTATRLTQIPSCFDLVWFRFQHPQIFLDFATSKDELFLFLCFSGVWGGTGFSPQSLCLTWITNWFFFVCLSSSSCTDPHESGKLCVFVPLLIVAPKLKWFYYVWNQRLMQLERRLFPLNPWAKQHLHLWRRRFGIGSNDQ